MNLERIGKYEIVSTIGRGSMGLVYKAHDPEIGRLVAIKTLRSLPATETGRETELIERFRVEARSAGKLRHPNIVTIFETGRTPENVPYIVMDFIEGDSLEAIIQGRSPMDIPEALHYLAQIASAIDYAHSQKVYHRDIKPSNVIVDRAFSPQLLDFGVAKLSDTSLTPAGTVVGTPSYMSPEQIRGLDEGGGTDLFALAVIAFEMLAGSRPFPGKDFVTVVASIINRDPVSFHELKIGLPRELEKVLGRGLAKSKEDRFRGAMQLVEAIAKVFVVKVDGKGLIGGFRAGLTLEEARSYQAGEVNSKNVETVAGPVAETPSDEEGRQDFFGETEETSISIPLSSHSVEGTLRSKKILGPAGEAREMEGKIVEVQGEAGDDSFEDAFSLGGVRLSRVLDFISTIGIVILVVSIGVFYFFEMNSGIRESSSPLSGKHLVTENQTEFPSERDGSNKVVEPGGYRLDQEVPKDTVGMNESGFEAMASKVISSGDKLSLTQLCRMARNSPFGIKVRVLKLLEDKRLRENQAAVSGLGTMLLDNDPLIRAKAAKILGTFDSDEALKLIRERLSIEPDPFVRKILSQQIAPLE